MEPFKQLISRWKVDLRGLRSMEIAASRNKEWDEALRFQVAHETMETLVREAEAALKLTRTAP